MVIEDFLSKLEKVCATRRGWLACCPGHDDRNPSLSIREGERGILLKCWSGCRIDSITAALGIAVRDLFYDQEQDPREWREAQRRRDVERKKREARQSVDGLTADALREAERFVASRRDLDISGWSADRLDDELIALTEAYLILDCEALYG